MKRKETRPSVSAATSTTVVDTDPIHLSRGQTIDHKHTALFFLDDDNNPISEKKDKGLIFTHPYQFFQIFANYYKTWSDRTSLKQLSTIVVQIRITKASINAAAVEKGMDLFRCAEF